MGKTEIITYDQILVMASTILESDVFDNNRVTITYKLPSDVHKKLNEELFYKGNNEGELEYTNIIEVEIASVVFNFIIEE